MLSSLNDRIGNFLGFAVASAVGTFGVEIGAETLAIGTGSVGGINMVERIVLSKRVTEIQLSEHFNFPS